jgi:hypothetical protein
LALWSAFRALLVAAGIAALAGSAGCQAASSAPTAVQSDIDALKAAYYNILELEKCVDLAPDAADPRLAHERRRTSHLRRQARARSLQPYLDEAAARWRHIDALADKVCYFQMNDFKGTSAALLREANDRFQQAIARF